MSLAAASVCVLSKLISSFLFLPPTPRIYSLFPKKCSFNRTQKSTLVSIQSNQTDKPIGQLKDAQIYSYDIQEGATS